MPQDEKDQQETETTPTGYTVPVPKRDEFFGNLKKAAKPRSATGSPVDPEERQDFNERLKKQVGQPTRPPSAAGS
jgi:hypothetical protein